MLTAAHALAHVPLWSGLEKTEALVLGTRPLGEHDRLVFMLDGHGARRRAVARGAQSQRHPWTEHLVTMSRIEAAIEDTRQRDLPALELSALAHSPFAAYGRPAPGALLLHLAAAARHLAQEGLERPPLFRLFAGLSETAENAAAGAQAAALLLYAGFWSLRLEGLLPELRRCSRCRRAFGEKGAAWRRRERALLCARCAGGREPLSAAALAFARECMKRKPAGMLEMSPLEAGPRRQAGAWLDALCADSLDWNFGWQRRTEEVAEL